MEENLITSTELVEFLKITRKTLFKLIKEGLPCIKVGSDYRFSKNEVLEHLKHMEEGEAECQKVG